jgi:putative component of membrane protein insertase Oxa1/YidC/SpoIIIJ protein YidD
MKKVLTFFLACCFSLMLYGQLNSDSTYLKSIFSINAELVNYNNYFTDSVSEIKILFSFSFLYYKKYVSSQDVDACVFSPSCSVYTIESVNKKGIFWGLLDGFDRLLRCNAFVNEKDYEYNKFTKKYSDAP